MVISRRLSAGEIVGNNIQRFVKPLMIFAAVALILFSGVAVCDQARAASCYPTNNPNYGANIGFLYIAQGCLSEGRSTYNRYDLNCNQNGVVEAINESAGSTPRTADEMQAWITGYFNFLVDYGYLSSYYRDTLKMFRNASGSSFVLVVGGYSNTPGSQIDGKSMSSYPYWPTYNPVDFGRFEFPGDSTPPPCCISVTPPASAISVKPTAGETTTVNATLASNYPLNWQLNIDGAITTGSGSSVSVPWEGKYANNYPFLPGSYTATLTASSAGCTDVSSTFPVEVADPPNYSLQMCFGSSANIAGGGLAHSEEIFSLSGAPTVTLDIDYNSQDPSSGTLGPHWRHTLDITLANAGNGSLLLREGGSRRLYTYTGGAYQPPAGDYSTLVKNGDGTYLITEKDGIRKNFDANGRLVSLVDRNGNAATLSYNGANLASVTNASGRAINFTYDSENRIISAADPKGNTCVFTYTGAILTGITYPDGGQRTYLYNSDGLLQSRTDSLGNAVSYTYGASRRVTDSTDPAGKSRTLSYPSGSDTIRTTTFTEKDGGVWLFTYDTRMGVLTAKTDPLGNTTTYTYDADGNMLTMIVPDGSVTAYTYDAQGNVLSMTDALSQTTAYTYNAFGQVLTATDPIGRTTTYTYDDKGNLTQSIDPLGAKTTFAYDTKGNLTSVNNALNQTSSFTYDAADNLVFITDPTGSVTTFTYDAMGSMLTETDALGNTTRFEYDTMNRLTRTTDAQGNVTTFTYDANGNMLTGTDANGKTTSFEYNFQGQPLKSIDALGNISTYTYSSTGCSSCGGGVDKLTSVTDANGNATTYEYDSRGRLVKETDARGKITAFSYVVQGNLTARTDANGNTTNYQYDSLGRLLKKTYPDNSEATFTYNAVGNILTAANQNISYSFAYDAKGRIVSVVDSNGRTVGYEYDILGNRTKLTAPDGKIISYSYDADNRLKKLTSDTSSFGFTYDKLGRTVSVLNPNGARAVSTYDSLSNLRRLYGINAAVLPITYYGYTYDKVGNRLTRAERTRNFSYAYDPVYRLTGTTASIAGANEAYTYDPVGNRLTGPAAEAYNYAAASELTAKTGATYQYDDNGNLIGKTEGTTNWSYGYDFENRLSWVTKNTGTEASTITFKYDPFGRRIEKSVTAGSTTTTKYLYDGQNVLYEYDGSDAITARYVHNLGIDDPLAMEKNAKLYVYYKDALGSVTAITDYWGNIVQTYDYDSFGNIVAVNDPAFVQPYIYTGREWDSETGLYYYRARYYDPMAGRFISRDPISFAGGDVNLYGYVQNNPVSFIDPSGLEIATAIGLPQGHNPFGHVAAAVTGRGVYSSGTKEAFGSSFTTYLQNQSIYRDSVVFILPTTKEQDEAFVKAFLEAAKRGHSAYKNNCADITGEGLKAADLIKDAALLKFPNMLFNYMMLRANEGKVSTIISISKGNQDWQQLVEILNQFNP
jgi:RHS repeat-associated protein